MARKRVAVVIEDLRVGGLERIVEEIVMGLRGTVDFSVICLRDGGRIYDRLSVKGIATEIISVRGLYDFFGMMHLVYRLQCGRFDAVHTHGVTGNALGCAGAYLAGVRRVIAHVHSLTAVPSRFGRFKEQCLNERGRTIVFCSKAAEASYRRIYPLAEGKSRVVYNGVACEHFAACDRIALRPVVFGCVASLYAHKGHAVLIDAVRILRDQKIEVAVVCAGTGPLHSTLCAQANAAGVFESVRFLGQLDDIIAFFKTIDIMVLPSTEREGMPMSVLEAMAAGKAVIASDVGGVREAVQNGVTGILVPPGDAAALAQAMRRTVLDTMGASTMGAAAQRIARADFSRLTMLEKIEALYG